jgi:hypothetical protein
VVTVIQFVTLIASAFFVVKRGEDKKWTVRYAWIIVAPAVLGFALTLLVEYLVGAPDDLTISIGLVCGYIGLAIAAAWDYGRSGGIYKGKRRKSDRSDKTVI